MRVQDALRKPAVTIECDHTITETARLMDDHAVGAVVVTDQGRPTGIVTDRDLALRALGQRLASDARVDSIMTTDLYTLPSDADLRDALPIFRSHAVRRLPVVDGDRVIGMLSVDDLLVDLAGDLTDLARPVTGQVIFGHPEPAVPASEP